MNNNQNDVTQSEIHSENDLLEMRNNTFEYEIGKTKYIVSLAFPKGKKVTMDQLLQRCAAILCELG